MPHHTPPTFEALPVEVLSNILRQMSSPEDLYSTIRASPRAFGSFLCFREKILIGVLQACLHVEIFAEFLGLLHAPKYEDYNYVPTQRYVHLGESWISMNIQIMVTKLSSTRLPIRIYVTGGWFADGHPTEIHPTGGYPTDGYLTDGYPIVAYPTGGTPIDSCLVRRLSYRSFVR